MSASSVAEPECLASTAWRSCPGIIWRNIASRGSPTRYNTNNFPTCRTSWISPESRAVSSRRSGAAPDGAASNPHLFVQQSRGHVGLIFIDGEYTVVVRIEELLLIFVKQSVSFTCTDLFHRLFEVSPRVPPDFHHDIKIEFHDFSRNGIFLRPYI